MRRNKILPVKSLLKRRLRQIPWFTLLLCSCTGTQYLQEGQRFYEGPEIKIETREKVAGQKRVTALLEAVALPKPNRRLLGMRPGVWFYGLAGNPKKEKGIRNNLKRKFGEKPVLISDVSPREVAERMEGELANNGYFRSRISEDIVTKGSGSKVVYTVFLERPYRIGKITPLVMDSTQQPEINATIRKTSLLATKQRYRLERLQSEQERVEEVLEDHGYYYFDDRHLIFEADSTVGNRRIALEYKFETNMPQKAKRVYRLKTVNVFPDYDLTADSTLSAADTIRINSFNYIDRNHFFRPAIITEVINLRPDSIYRRIDQEYTITHLMGMKAFKFVNVKFMEDPNDSARLNANIYLTPLPKKSIRMQLQAVSKSNNFVGPGFEATLTNRNFLRGAELLQFKLHSAYEVQISRQRSGALNALELGAASSLSVPRFLTPIPIQYNSAKYVPQTQIKLSYNLQQRMQYFTLASINAGYGYLWRETTLKTHELFPIDVSFVRSGNTSPEFNKLLDQSPALANSFQNQFILGGHYTFVLNTQLREDFEAKFDPESARKSNFYFSGTADFSGNTLRALQRIGGVNSGENRVLGYPYSQFVKGEIDFRHFLQLSRHDKLAMRFIAGVGYAYGNSTTMPYIKQFSSGGSTSIRAFPARSIGPGTYNVRTDESVQTRTFFIDQRGDMKLEGSAEYRFDIVKAFKGAVFVDAGNIWLRRDDPEGRPGGVFHGKTFLNQLAVGTGVGLRLDFSFFVLRFDTAFPLRKPYLDPEDRWVFNQIDFTSRDWRRQNLVLNIAIGYPF